MAKVSNTVQERIKELYALLASVAAQRAIDHVKISSDPFGANRFVDAAEEWLGKSSANCARWTYHTPRIDR